MIFPSDGKSFRCVDMETSIRKQMQVSDLNRLNGNSALCHAVCGLTEEAGEVAGLLKREVFRENEIPKERWIEELGDVLWYAATLAHDLGFTLDEVAQMNLDKLASRMKRDKIHGSGDER